MINLASRIQSQLPADLVGLIAMIGGIAASLGMHLYLAGGVVRDLLLGRTNLDLDLVVEGDAISLAQKLVGANPGKLTTHPRFNTAKIRWSSGSIDLATARSETYAKPGALPTVKPSSLHDDLFRRDFTINAMAIHLDPDRYGKLVDLCRGMHDLEHKLIRVLHESSFIDDATRIWRGLRYEQRLDFLLEPATLRLLKRDLSMLDIISGDRIRHELELVLKEEYPEKALRRAGEFGVLERLHPSLKGNGWLERTFKDARRLNSPTSPSAGLYMALLTYSLTAEDIERLILRLRLPKSLARTLQDTASIKSKLPSLADPKLTPSHIYRLLHGVFPPAITASIIASGSPITRHHLRQYLDRLRYVKPALTGDDLKRLGISPGPRVMEILQLLLEARLIGKVTSKKGEESLVKRVRSKGTKGRGVDSGRNTDQDY